MTLHSEIWRKSIIGLSVEEIAADLSETIDRMIVVPDKVAFVTACLANVRRDPLLALDFIPPRQPYISRRPEWVPATEERHRDMEERFLNGETPDEIAESYGLCRETIIHHLKRRGVLRRKVSHELARYQNPENMTFCPVQEVVDAQRVWERRQAILRARRAGETLSSLGKAIDRSTERVRQIIRKAERQEGKPSPLEKWMADKSYLREIAEKLNLIPPLAERARNDYVAFT